MSAIHATLFLQPRKAADLQEMAANLGSEFIPVESALCGGHVGSGKYLSVSSSLSPYRLLAPMSGTGRGLVYGSWSPGVL